MITGLREFRKKLSEHTAMVQKGKIVVITDRDTPTAALISINKLRELAKKAHDSSIITQLIEAQVDENKEFIDLKKSFLSEIDGHIDVCKKAEGRIPYSVIEKLMAIRSATYNLVSDSGAIEDERMLMNLRNKSHGPISRVLDYDYYNVHKDFIEKTREEAMKLFESSVKSDKLERPLEDFKMLADMVDNAVVRKKTKFDEKTMTERYSVLVRVFKKGKYYSSRIYTVMPYWYEHKKGKENFVQMYSTFGRKLSGRKVGDKFKYKTLEFEILSIT